jgi:hypothetical protein
MMPELQAIINPRAVNTPACTRIPALRQRAGEFPASRENFSSIRRRTPSTHWNHKIYWQFLGSRAGNFCTRRREFLHKAQGIFCAEQGILCDIGNSARVSVNRNIAEYKWERGAPATTRVASPDPGMASLDHLVGALQ